MPAGDRPDHFVPRVAYSTGLLLGRILVEIIADLIGAHPRKGNRMSTAKFEVSELRRRRRGDETDREGRVLTHEEAVRRLAPWLASDAKREILEVLAELPDDCTLEDVQYSLYVREQIRQGIWSLENEPTYTQEEVEQSLSRWLAG